jgi:hypothetical protein
MVTSNTPEEELPAEPSSEPTSEEASAEPEEIDWSVRGPELQSQIEKLQNDIRSREVPQRRNADRDEDIRGLKDGLSALTKTTAQFMSHLSKDDPDLGAQLASVEQSNRTAQANSRLEARRDQIMQDIEDIVRDGENLRISDDDSQKIVQLWQTAQEEALKTGDASPLYEAKIAAQRAVTEFERKESQAAIRKEKSESKEREKKALEKAGVFDQDTGPVTTGGSEELRGTDAIKRALEKGTSRIQM